ncbi:PadR family transcriptional regulator [Tsukamurella tyrosinosolvens]|uniref:PadR family transcriptional regulator, regulatory protein PadR n=1 Tax=Tsukamurella tyrosinosolvens TaxID=57704 RepID=A0A1H4LWD1_TSUTY|nr:PadR family transcriptional regulator [Tsukamurella tyrosinosolvens]KXO96737.1 PadR family transcriptional regulator [Tsukamurella tyrosinosolvens]KXP02283.1 PadR family transcriptional regulator [Tsukamurella tyrosinosolvens]KZL96421.1 PadR family transcriptional regulator [Tsukamurella tyrosinosolvens]MCA4996297.1 PadR family transcriptional regulator [Tsukamurella tyrosinosolvens]QRY85768.1 PadR family transcriptional regulator [Tsukamurella tyrosinosolvens]
MSTAAWQRATLPLLILGVLESAPRHGYGVSAALVEVGLQPIKGAQLYPALVKLENDGCIVAEWEQSESGPARKVYELTDAGRTELARLRDEWREFTAAAAALGAAPAR